MATILVVDDEARIRDVVQYALEREGFRVVLAADGGEALERLDQTEVDLVILDVLMPDLDGLSVCRTIRQRSSLPIIFLSSRSEEVDRILGLELGGDDYVTKPFSPRELATRVKAVLRRTAARERADGDEARQRFLANILADAQRLDRLVTRLLELSRVEADPAPMEVLDYQALVREAAQGARDDVPVVLDYRASHRRLRGRGAHLTSVLGNLIDNAQQHAEADTEVAIRVVDGPEGCIRTSVHNVGPPIREAKLERIWDRFFTTRADQGGTGLGLPIVDAVVRAHGGTVAVRSTAEDGTHFSVELPTGL